MRSGGSPSRAVGYLVGGGVRPTLRALPRNRRRQLPRHRPHRCTHHEHCLPRSGMPPFRRPRHCHRLPSQAAAAQQWQSPCPRVLRHPRRFEDTAPRQCGGDRAAEAWRHYAARGAALGGCRTRRAQQLARREQRCGQRAALQMRAALRVAAMRTVRMTSMAGGEMPKTVCRLRTPRLAKLLRRSRNEFGIPRRRRSWPRRRCCKAVRAAAAAPTTAAHTARDD